MRFFIAAIFVCLAGCSATPQRSQEPRGEESTLRLSFSTHPATLDPRKTGDFASSTLVSLLYEGLARCKGGSEIELALAERVEMSPDKKTYLFHLRESLWSDGRPVTAYDFEKSWKKILQPGFPSLCTYLLYPIKNGERCAKGDVSPDEVGVLALDAQTLRVDLERPTPYFLSLTAFPLYLPIPSHIDEGPSDWEKNPTPLLVCNGPFILEKISANAEILLKKNPSFWNPSQINLDQISISIVSDEITALQMFERGELDWIGGPLSPLPPDALQSLKERSQLHFLPMNASTFCTFNTETFPFKSARLRKAFASAIDREKIASEIALAGQIPAKRCLPPSLIGSDRPPLLKTDSKEAKTLFSEALAELSIEPSDLNGMTLYFKSNQTDKRLAQALQRQWLEILGVEVKLEQLDPKSQLKRLYERNYQISLASWIAQFDDPVNILERFRDRTSPKNYPGWENETYSRLLEEAGETADPQERLEKLVSAEKILAEETILAPLYHWSAATLFHPRVQNFATTSSGGVLFERCSLSRQ